MSMLLVPLKTRMTVNATTLPRHKTEGHLFCRLYTMAANQADLFRDPMKPSGSAAASQLDARVFLATQPEDRCARLCLSRYSRSESHSLAGAGNHLSGAKLWSSMMKL